MLARCGTSLAVSQQNLRTYKEKMVERKELAASELGEFCRANERRRKKKVAKRGPTQRAANFVAAIVKER